MLDHNQQMPKQLVLPAQPIPNPNLNIISLAYQDDQDNVITLNFIDCNDIQLISRKKLFELAPPVIIDIIDEKETRKEKHSDQNTTKIQESENKRNEEKKEVIPYLERLEIQPLDSKLELLKELNKLNISIPILQAIKEVPKLNKMMKELCI